MKGYISILALIMSFPLFSQVGVNGGFSLLKGFSPQKPWVGIHLGLEIPRDDEASLYGRITHHFRQSAQDSLQLVAVARDFNTIPYTVNVKGLPSMNYTIIEGGSRYYIGNGFDYGWAGYGGSCVQLIFNKIKVGYGSFDESLYEIDEFSRVDGSIFSLGFGLAGGVKYSMGGVGTFYFDVGVSYSIFAIGSTDYVYPEMFDPLIFSFALGYRKDIGW